MANLSPRSSSRTLHDAEHDSEPVAAQQIPEKLETLNAENERSPESARRKPELQDELQLQQV